MSCGHTMEAHGFTYTCDQPVDHKDWHGETKQLFDGPSTTNWGDDGLAIWASKDDARRAASEKALRKETA